MTESKHASIDLNNVPIEWNLEQGRMSFFGLPAVTFWLAPSLLRMLEPLRKEVGGDLYRLIVAYQASLGTKEDYQNIVTVFGTTFEEGFHAWAAAVSAAGWGHFEIESFSPEQRCAVVRIKNPWELQMLEGHPEGESWGCPFLLGKIIGIFSHALGTNCWADEKHIQLEHGASSMELHIYAHELTIEQELEELREQHKRERERELELEIATRIQERIRAEEAERASERKFRTLVETINAAIFIYRDSTILFVNPMASELTGYSEAELYGMDFWELLHPDQRQAMQQRAKAHQLGTLLAAFEARILHKDGSSRWLSFNASPLEFAGEEALLGVAYDIEERRQAEAEQAQIQRQVEHTQRLESLGVLAGGIAHDFNNILTAIMGNAALARRQAGDTPPAVTAHLSRIVQSSEKAALLCRQMLAYSGKGQFVISPLDLSAQLKEVTELLEVSIQRGVALRYHLADNLPPIAADESQLQQVIMNLVINASDSMADSSGIVTLSTGVMHADRAYLKGTAVGNDLDQGHYVYLEVSDTGSGMDAKTISQVFEPFFTTKFTGRGLGMSAVLGIVRGHKGAIRIYSELGKGSTFKVLFPVMDGASQLTCSADPPQKTSALDPQGTVLVIDDESIVRETSMMMLEAFGYQTLCAKDAMEGIGIYAAHKETIQAVLLDMTMPGLDGKGCFRELRRLNPDVAVVLMSGYNEREATSRFTGKGLAGFLQKPFMPSDLERIIGEAVKLKN